MTDENKASPTGASPSPYELVFGSALFEADRFPAIRAEAEARGVATEIPERFLLLGTVGALLQELLPESAGAAEFSRHGTLLYQAYHFWLHGKRHCHLTEGEARELVERPPEPARWHLDPPIPAGYLQLPRHLFWARIEEGATPEPVDGFFWTVAGAVDVKEPVARRLELLLPLGLFPGRPGFSTIVIETPIDRGDADPRADDEARQGGQDFANILPGGELQGWYGLITELEVLKLVSRTFQTIESHGR